MNENICKNKKNQLPILKDTENKYQHNEYNSQLINHLHYLVHCITF